MPELIISREYLLACYYEACNWLDHAGAVAQVAGETGHSVETVEAVIQEEATAA